MEPTALIGLDWGTTMLRAYRFDDRGRLVASRQLASGFLQVVDAGAAGFARAFHDACGDWLAATTPVLACGMVGAAQGWREAAYVPLPAGLDQLARALTTIDTGHDAALHIVPGAIARGALPDVMRGEETQIFGALDARDATASAPEAWIALPGTHAKWVRIRGGDIRELHTFLTGELFAVLCAHSILGRTMRPAAAPDLAAFDRGVAMARSADARAGVLTTVFSTRTLGLTGALAAEAQADYLSGLLIGHELAGLEALVAPLAGWAPVRLVGDPALCSRYQRALAAFGHDAAAIVPHATERGLWRIAVAAGLVAEPAS